MKYGRHQIDKAGDILISSKNTEEVSTAIEKINDWRTLQGSPANHRGNIFLTQTKH